MKCFTSLNFSTESSPKYFMFIPFSFKTFTAASQEALLSLYLESASPLFLLVLAITTEAPFKDIGAY